MIKALHPFFCTSNRCVCCQQRFENLSTLFDCSELTWNEKVLWMWAATHCAKNAATACTFSYEQISLAMNQSCKQVHRALTRLKVVGFLLSDSPIWYYELSKLMCTKIHTFTPVVPDKNRLEKLKSYRADPEGYRRYLINELTSKNTQSNLIKMMNSLIKKLKEENDAKPFNPRTDC